MCVTVCLLACLLMFFAALVPAAEGGNLGSLPDGGCLDDVRASLSVCLGDACVSAWRPGCTRLGCLRPKRIIWLSTHCFFVCLVVSSVCLYTWSILSAAGSSACVLSCFGPSRIEGVRRRTCICCLAHGLQRRPQRIRGRTHGTPQGASWASRRPRTVSEGASRRPRTVSTGNLAGDGRVTGGSPCSLSKSIISIKKQGFFQCF